MKLEEILAECPKCGSKDKTAHRRMIDNHHAHAELDTVKCDNCGYVFETKSKENNEKNQIINELNKKF